MTIGDNQPNSYEAIKSRVDDLIETANRWIAERPEIQDENTAKKADLFLGQIQAELKAAEAARKAEKEPHLEAGKAVDEKWKPLSALLETTKKVLGPRLADYLRRKQEKLDRDRAEAEAEARKAVEEAEAAAALADNASVQDRLAAEEAQKRAEDALKAAEALPARAAVKSEYSERARSLRGTWKARLVNYAAAVLYYRDHPEVRSLLERLASAEARGGKRTLPGFEIYEEKI